MTLTSFGHAPQSGIAAWRRQSLPLRVARGLWAWLAMWATGTIAVFLPFQITSVPRLFAGGVFLARFHWRERERLLTVDGVCPRCAHAQRFRPGPLFPIESRLVCGACHHDVFCAL